ncbi:efflux RND transporter permease subunit, partial [Candidatus Hydrogenedentota bacterium]
LITFEGVREIDDGVSLGKTQLDFTVKPEARSLGISSVELARQVRSAYYGIEALRQQRGRDEVRVMVRLPERERESEYGVEELIIRTPAGGDMPIRDAAEVARGRAYTEIIRADGRRVINVTADVVEGVANPGKIMADLQEEALPDLLKRYPGIMYSLEGEQREQSESMGGLRKGFIAALFVIYALLAIPFKSYVQPAIIMVAIPFGIVGAVIGHLIMGYDLSIISMMGIVALSGVVVNDSLILIDTANRRRRMGDNAHDAIAWTGQRRFRPIILTSMTTFLGLAPMIFETSVQARFLIPMAISLGYGILFATGIALILVPSLYLIVEDVRRVLGIDGNEGGC